MPVGTSPGGSGLVDIVAPGSLTTSKPVSDSASGTDAPAKTITTFSVSVTDSATGGNTLGLAVAASLSESGAGGEAARGDETNRLAAVTETASGAETATEFTPPTPPVRPIIAQNACLDGVAPLGTAAFATSEVWVIVQHFTATGEEVVVSKLSDFSPYIEDSKPTCGYDPDIQEFTLCVGRTTTPSLGEAFFYRAYNRESDAPGALFAYADFDAQAVSDTLKDVADNASGADTLAGSARLVSLAETGAGGDAPTLTASAATAETGGGAEEGVGPSQGVLASETGSGADAGVVGLFVLPTSERGRGAELAQSTDGGGAVTLGALWGDGGAGADAADVLVTISAQETAAGQDGPFDETGDYPPRQISVTNAGAGADVADAPTKTLSGTRGIWWD